MLCLYFGLTALRHCCRSYTGTSGPAEDWRWCFAHR